MSNEVASATNQYKFPQAYWIANFIDIVQYCAWYAFYGNISLYVTGSASNGALGLTDIDRVGFTGVLLFLGYITPTIAGALSDRYGYKKMYVTAFLIMIPAYLLAGFVKTYWGFFGACVLLGIGLGCFRPLAVGVISNVTNESNRGMGFGINYALFNIGAVMGTLIAGYMKAISWDWVFITSALVLLINFLLVSKMVEPSEEAKSSHSGKKRSLKEVLADTQEVLGNGRVAIMVIPILITLLIAGAGGMSLGHFLVFTVFWLFILNLAWSSLNQSNNKKLIALAVPLFMVVGVIITSQLQWAEDAILPSFVSNTQSWLVLIAVSVVWLVLRLGKINIPTTASNLLLMTLSPLIFLEVAVQMELLARSMMFVLFGAWSFLLLMHFLFGSHDSSSEPSWYQEKPKIGNWPFVIYLLILSGFWAVYKQIFLTMPLYLRDFVDTAPVLQSLGWEWIPQGDLNVLIKELTNLLATYTGVIPEASLSDVLKEIRDVGFKVPQAEFTAGFQAIQANFADPMAQLSNNWAQLFSQGDITVLGKEITHLVAKYPDGIPQHSMAEVLAIIQDKGVTISQSELTAGFQIIQSAMTSPITQLATQWKQQYAQIDPTLYFNVNFFSIVLLQVFVSQIISRFDTIKVLITGCLIITIVWSLCGFAHHLTWSAIFMVLVTLFFSLGEMIASPKSYEYVATFAPKGKVGMFMGYSFVSYGIGGIFAALLSGLSYQHFAVDRNSPEILWLIIAGVGLLTCIALFIFNKTVVHHIKEQQKAVREEQKEDVNNSKEEKEDLMPA